jgi:hypothetical protein
VVLLGRTFRSLPARLAGIGLSTIGQGLVAALIIWAFFGFRFSTFNPALPGGEYNLPWPVVLSYGGWKAALIKTCLAWHVLPEGWLYGLAFVFEHAMARASFLDGDYGIFGWVEFFPKTFLYKTPPSLLVALLVGGLLLALHLRKMPASRLAQQCYRIVPLAALFGVYWLFSLTSHLNIGHRHILPTYPVLYIFCGVLGWSAVRAWRLSRSGGLTATGVVGALLLWQLATTIQIHPHYLAYFSPAAGGPSQGYRHLVDSSLDWGQDLPAWKRWLAQNRRAGEPAYISYFGSDEPRRFVADAVILPRMPAFALPRPWYWPEPGVYAVSATQLQHVYSPEFSTWSREHETRYQQLRLNDAQFRALRAHPDHPAELLQGLTYGEWEQAWKLYEQLRFARLCVYLRSREPDASAGYSILIYRLSAEDLKLALESDLPAFIAAVAKPPASGK